MKNIQENSNWVPTRIYEVQGDPTSRQFYIGKGNEYTRVAKGNDSHKSFIEGPFFPFPAMVKGGELVPDLNKDSIYKKLDPQGASYPYAINYSERIKAVLKSLENPKDVFSSPKEGDLPAVVLARAVNTELIELGVAEVIDGQGDEKIEFWRKRKLDLIAQVGQDLDSLEESIKK